MFFWLSLDYFVLVVFDFVVLGSVFFQYYAKRAARKWTYFMSSGT